MRVVHEIYPLTVCLDRYSGVYSGGKYIAWNKSPRNIPYDASADDTSCLLFWLEYDGIVGKGDTIKEAIDDLYFKIYGGNYD